jgi:hypothetical protein
MLLTHEPVKNNNNEKPERKTLTASWKVVDGQLTCQWLVS